LLARIAEPVLIPHFQEIAAGRAGLEIHGVQIGDLHRVAARGQCFACRIEPRAVEGGGFLVGIDDQDHGMLQASTARLEVC
jgi:hypothetical protein